MKSLKVIATVLILALVLAWIYIAEFRVFSSLNIDSFLMKGIFIYILVIFTRAFFLILFSFFERIKSPVEEISVYPFFSIIVPCFNEEKVIEKAIDSCLSIDYPNFEVLVIDDGSKDSTYKVAKRLEKNPRLRVFRQENRGKWFALNHGISNALGEYVLCMDADSLLDKDVLKNAVREFSTYPQISALAGNVRLGNSGILLIFQKLEYLIGLNFYKMAQSFFSAVMVVPGPVGIFKKKALLEVGGYSGETFAEDSDLTLKLLLNGYKIKYSSNVVAYTEGPENLQSLLSQRYRWSRGILQAFLKNFKSFRTPFKNPRTFFIYLNIAFESFVIPISNVLITILGIQIFLLNRSIVGFIPLIASLTLLEVILTFYNVFWEKRLFGLLFLAVINRLTYNLFIDFLRVLAFIDEMVGIPMTWGKLERRGMSNGS